MGNHHIHHNHTKVIEKVNPAAEEAARKEIEQLKTMNKSLIQQARKTNNPENIKNAHEKQLQQYLAFIGKKQWNESLSNTHGVKHNVVVGNISAGKSSILNCFFGLKLEVGVDETTMEASAVRKGKVTIWDSPGINEDFDLFDPKALKLFATANKIFLLFNTSLRSSKNEARILYAVRNPSNLYCIRTQCDRFESPDALDQALSRDKSILAGWGINAPVLATSSVRGMEFRDNRLVKTLMDE